MVGKNEGYCVKCRTKRQIVGAKHVRLDNGQPAIKGKCAKCGTTIYKFVKKGKGKNKRKK